MHVLYDIIVGIFKMSIVVFNCGYFRCLFPSKCIIEFLYCFQFFQDV